MGHHPFVVGIFHETNHPKLGLGLVVALDHPWLGFSMKQTIQLLVYPHDYGNLHDSSTITGSQETFTDLDLDATDLGGPLSPLVSKMMDFLG